MVPEEKANKAVKLYYQLATVIPEEGLLAYKTTGQML
tara:strand:+ start:295 stop:405 length:111 start_codon:yes stop_codon:yes gene_type:complete